MTVEEFNILVEIEEYFLANGIVWDPQVGDTYAYLTSEGVMQESVSRVFDAKAAPLTVTVKPLSQLVWVPRIEDKIGAILVISGSSMEQLLMALIMMENPLSFLELEADVYLEQLRWLDLRLTTCILNMVRTNSVII